MLLLVMLQCLVLAFNKRGLMKKYLCSLLFIILITTFGYSQTECPTVNPNTQAISNFNTVDSTGVRHSTACIPSLYNGGSPLVLPNIGLEAVQIANASATGTTNFTLTKLTGAPSTAVIAATTDNKNNSIVGITINGGGTTGNATIAYQGIVPCLFANATTAGDFVTVSTGTTGNCNDFGATAPTDGSLAYGRVLVTNAATGVVNLILLNSNVEASGGTPIGLAAGGTGLVQSASQTITTNGTAVAAGTCQAQPAATITGVTTTSTADWSIATALPATWQTGIHVMIVVTANTVTPSLCNASAGSITPAATVMNIKATL